MKRCKLWGVLLILGAILIRPEAAVSSGRRAMALWYSAVAPSLFPFLALMPVLTGPQACAAYESVLGKIMPRLFLLPGSAAPALIIGMISGSPGGAIAVRRVAAQTGMRKSDAARIGLAVAGVSPAYLVLGVGHALYGSAALGMKLAAVQLGIQLLLLLTLPVGDDSEAVQPDPDRRPDHPIPDAVESVLAVCGYMVLCGTAAGALAELIGKKAGDVLLILADLPTGLARIREICPRGAVLLTGAAVGFGGICIGLQNLDILGKLGVRARDYFAVRMVSAGIFACAAMLLGGNALPGGFSLPRPVKIYAFSLLFALAAVVPALKILSKTYFLTKEKFQPNAGSVSKSPRCSG